MPSLNLFRRDEMDIEAGGEFYIISISLKQKTSWAIYHNAGGILGLSEDVLIDLFRVGHIERIAVIHMMAWQCLRDLKASVFLALCGHYRQAAIISRAALELLVLGAYFQRKRELALFKGRNNKLEKEWEEWLKGSKSRPKFSAARGFLRTNGVIDEKIDAEIKEIYHQLSGLPHTIAGGDV